MHSVPVPLAAVVFDNDGLLLDTQTLWKRAQERLFAHHGRAFDASAESTLLGLSRVDAGAALATLLHKPSDRAHALYEQLEALVFDELAAGCTLMPGAALLVAALQRAGIPLGLASNSPRSFVTTALEHTDSAQFFDVVVTADEVRSPKPAPDVYQEACRQLGVAPSTAVALEDSPTGIQAATAAGLFVIAVPSPGTTTTQGADAVAASLDDPAVRQLFASAGVTFDA